MTIAKNTTGNGVFASVPLMSLLLAGRAVFAPEDGSGGGVGGFEEAPREDIEDELQDDDDGSLDAADAEDAFLTNLKGADEATHPEGEEGDEDPEAEKPAKTEAKADAAEKPLAGDDATVEVKVGEETHKVPVKELKRLFGQEAALTQRSQAVATERAAVQAEATRAKAVVSKTLERAEARAKPYAEMDFWKLSKELDTETFAQLRKDAAEALDEVRFLKEEHQAADETITRTQRAATAEAAQACVKALQDKTGKHYVEGWSPEMYGELLTFAEAQGLDTAKQLTHPAAIKLLRMAMLYERGKTVVREQVKKVAQQPRRPLRPGTTGDSTPRTRAENGAFARLAKSGSADAAEDAFLSRLRARDAD